MIAITALQISSMTGLVIANIAILLTVLSCLVGMLGLSMLAAHHVRHHHR